MALTITADVDPVSLAVRLHITGGAPEYVVTAAPGGDRAAYTVRTTYTPVNGDPSGRVGLDGDAPLNVPTQYVVTDVAGVQAVSNTVEPQSAFPILSDALNPYEFLAVQVVSQPPNTWEARSVWWDVLGQRAPFVSVAPMRLRNGELVLLTESRGERASMLSLFQRGNPLRLRSVCPPAVDDVLFIPESVTDELAMDTHPAGPRLWRIRYQAVSQELGPYVVDPGRTYASLPPESPDYDGLLPLYVDYRALLAGTPYAGLGPEVLTNGGFTAALSGWDTFWTADASWDTSAGTALSTGTAGANTAYASLAQQPAAPIAASRVLRVTGRVRSTSPASAVWVWLYTNKAPGIPGPFQPGSVLTAVRLNPGPAWSTFAVDITVPDATHDAYAVFFRGEAMPVGALVEWDDVSARWHT